jgi:hypothetical protein
MSRPIRNPTQVRSILANLALSIEESRARRVGATPVAAPVVLKIEPVRVVSAVSAAPAPAPASTPAPRSVMLAPQVMPRLTPTPPSFPKGVVPPVRTQGEMFDGGVPRLKATPKRPS